MGIIVSHKVFGMGRTKNSDKLINGKIMVYFDDGQKVLCKQKNLTLIGWWD